MVLIADPIDPTPDSNYWIRTVPADGCGKENFVKKPLDNTGIIRYTDNNIEPTSHINPNISFDCSDEPYDLLRPVHKWTVGNPSNVNDLEKNTTYDVGFQPINGYPYHPEYDRGLWTIDNLPLWLHFGEPTILNLNTPEKSWHKYLDVVTQNAKEGDWIYLVIAGGDVGKQDPARQFFAVAHPIHLHGHDFAILDQSSTPYPGWEKVKHRIKPNLDNPPRRDVALLPSNGYLVIAFKADNPGTWLLHCHIAWHASSGLAMQILENTKILADRIANSKPNLQARIVDTCNAWNDWVGDVRNHYDPDHPRAFQDDSGI